MSKALHIHSKDNTAVCTSEVKAGEEVEVIDSDGSRSFINADKVLAEEMIGEGQR